MRNNTPHPGANALALTFVFVDFFSRFACALCTPANQPQSLAAAGFVSSFLATPDYKLCVLRNDTRVAHTVIFCAALLTRQRAKVGKKCLTYARFAPAIVKSYSPFFCDRLKSLADKSNKNEAF